MSGENFYLGWSLACLFLSLFAGGVGRGVICFLCFCFFFYFSFVCLFLSVFVSLFPCFYWLIYVSSFSPPAPSSSSSSSSSSSISSLSSSSFFFACFVCLACFFVSSFLYISSHRYSAMKITELVMGASQFLVL